MYFRKVAFACSLMAIAALMMALTSFVSGPLVGAISVVRNIMLGRSIVGSLDFVPVMIVYGAYCGLAARLAWLILGKSKTILP